LNWKDPQTAERYAGAGTTAALAGCSSDTLGALARAFGSPIAATSANVSPRGDDYGLGPSITIGEVQQFAAQTSTTLAAMIDGGICPQGHHMTVVDCTRAGEPEIIRDGTTHPRALTAALGTNLADASRKPSDRWRTPA
jgi:tRNA A37 threonylcarbamoyladenosine synthetase subunit TsaC/SUA5/YrdC